MRRLGYILLYHSWRKGSYEIDLIAWERGELVFVEVRTLSSGVPWVAENTIRSAKQESLRRAVEIFLAENPVYAQLPARIDVVAVRLTLPPQIEVFSDAFR